MYRETRAAATTVGALHLADRLILRHFIPTSTLRPNCAGCAIALSLHVPCRDTWKEGFRFHPRMSDRRDRGIFSATRLRNYYSARLKYPRGEGRLPTKIPPSFRGTNVFAWYLPARDRSATSALPIRKCFRVMSIHLPLTAQNKSRRARRRASFPATPSISLFCAFRSRRFPSCGRAHVHICVEKSKRSPLLKIIVIARRSDRRR